MPEHLFTLMGGSQKLCLYSMLHRHASDCSSLLEILKTWEILLDNTRILEALCPSHDVT